MSKKSWTPGRVIWWMIIGGLVGVVISGPIGSETLLTISGAITGLGLLLGAIRLMIK